MAFPQPYQTPDLAAVLQTLAACAPPRPPIQQTQEDDLEEGEYDPTEFHSIIPAPAQPPPPTLYPSHQYNEHNRPQIQQPPQSTYSAPTAPESHTTNLPPTPSAPPNPSPQPPQPSATEKASTITTYAPALRHTTHLLSTSPTTAARIRHLIRTAHTHERQWWSGRQSLLHQLSTRSASRQKLNSVLASIGGLTTKSEPETEKPVDDVEKELKMYDRKVHKAYGDMVKATYIDLGKLGIPFFCMKEGLVVHGKEAAGQEVEKGKVGEKELGVLRGRMLGFLEDWVREEG
ncbi:MAG: hypothetical protein LQ339_008821 [Xanthoria mediterranea]|nr:MAG: hypothetical protein LQ339_008821 [Xanthoria mediterranea]